MNKTFKIATSLLALCMLVISGLAISIHFFLTDERIRELVIPQAELALGRQVSLGKIEVSLFKGIIINDFMVKEVDNKGVFIKTDAFILKYDLMAILSQKISISEINIQKPQINISRDKDGVFNFATITALQESRSPQKAASGKAATALPLALAVDQIKISDAIFSLHDQTKKLPDANFTSNINLSVSLNKDMQTIAYRGSLETKGTAIYQETKVSTAIKANFDQGNITYQADTTIGQDKVTTKGIISNFTNSPDILLNISSTHLNLDYLAGLAAMIPASDKAETAPVSKTINPKAIGASLPDGLAMHGTINIKEAIYNKLTIDNFSLLYDLSQGILKLSDISAESAGGKLNSNIILDLNQADPAYSGNLSVQQMAVSAMKTPMGQALTEAVSGLLSTSINFDGAGFALPAIKKHLTANANYSLSKGAISNTAFTRQLAAVLKLPELKTISFDDISGVLKIIKGGKMRLNSTLNSADFQLNTDGQTDLNGNLDLPVTLTISPAMLQKIDQNGYLTRLFANEKGGATVNLQVDGDYMNPQITLDQQAVKEAVTKSIMDSAINELQRSLNKDSAGSADENSGKASTKAIRSLFNSFLGQ